ncbi:MAG TPA: thioredoxin domain-containing protein, partial [Candidatus Binatia bacterium]|nr:thioredoxin domain-containing protein [Candidatus Binatia bacterium]
MTRVPGGLVVVGLLTLAAALLAGCRSRPPVLETPPGAAARPADVVARLAAALAAKGPDYRPHTRHLRPDGTPRWTNRLILAASPYLLQHAHNPVDWYPWGDEVFDRARREGKPVLLSIGYSTCHWCHVMEEESFEDEEVARALNEHYVAIKVDREERPDLDEAYMTAVQLMTRSGGWPMTVWLTPERRPFYGGTYFPARDGDRGIPTGFLTLLTRLHEIFVADPLRVAAQADRVVAAVESLGTPAPGDAPPDASALRAAVATWSASFDPEHGGFGPAPRFPTPAALDVLLRWHRRTGDPRALAMVTATLEHMAAGGIHDQVGGGFHRYATDVAWTVPHFEKTLPDNAALAATYVTAWQATGRPEFAAVARDVLDWLAREMSDPRGGFWSATDADSGTGEGAFFTWTPAEVEAVLPPDAAAAVEAFFDVRAPGSSGGRSILHAPRPLAAVAAERGTTPEALAATLAAARAVLRAARDRRPRPATDTKIVAAWNGLAIS